MEFQDIYKYVYFYYYYIYFPPNCCVFVGIWIFKHLYNLHRKEWMTSFKLFFLFTCIREEGKKPKPSQPEHPFLFIRIKKRLKNQFFFHLCFKNPNSAVPWHAHSFALPTSTTHSPKYDSPASAPCWRQDLCLQACWQFQTSTKLLTRCVANPPAWEVSLQKWRPSASRSFAWHSFFEGFPLLSPFFPPHRPSKPLLHESLFKSLSELVQHRIVESLELEGTFKGYLVQLPCNAPQVA